MISVYNTSQDYGRLQDTSPQAVITSRQDVSQVQLQIQDAYRQFRGTISKKTRIFGLINCLFGVLLMVIGALSIYYGAPDVPYVLPLHVVTGIMLLADGMCAYQAGRLTQKEDTVTPTIKCLMLMVYCLSLVGVTFCFVTAGINGGMGIGFCLGTEYSRTGNVQRLNDQCTENKERNIAFCIVIILISVLAGIHCILVTVFFCVYGRFYGVTNRRRRIILLHRSDC
ncbi:uncharacterized protein LOC117342791 [Pecten maximus]|uniref:uncharacterized protein LOC117342791 n=1 Tax=Pecten maximus TaxID=6579 RepID=UPI0014580F78|nr:uncharacterized protein LOC117342791 [Pecten maximus]